MTSELEYLFPVVYFYSDDYEDSEVEYHPGYAALLEKNGETYEAVITAHGCKFHIIFGHYQNGWYICIPSKNFGCELARPGDVCWNLESMTRATDITDMDYEDAVAITYGLARLSDYINEE